MTNTNFTRFRGLFFGVFLAFSATSAQAEDLEFELINRTDTAIVAFFVSHSGTKNWESDLMRGDTLGAHESATITIADGRSSCEYDIRAEFKDGEALEDYEINLCDTGSYTFSD